MTQIDDQADLLAAEEPKAPVILNTEHARTMVRKRFSPPEWACMLEVAPATGGGTRYADAVAVNLWSSRGHAVIGMEIKVSRSDWLRELKKPEKAETSVFRFCDRWYVVAPKGVVKEGELPTTWGLLELRATGLVEVVAAPKLTPEPVTKGFFASLMRRSFEQIEALAGQKAFEAKREATARTRDEIARGIEQGTREHRGLLKHLAELKAETGIDIAGGLYGDGRTSASTIKLAQRLESLAGYSGDGALGRLAQLARGLDEAAESVRKAMAETELDAGDGKPEHP
jgi:hypothetical protein